MPAITDLTWAQLSAKLPQNTIATSNGSVALPAGVYINLSALTGDTIDATSDMGLVEAMLKLLKGAREAQVTANIGQAVNEQLNAFPPPTTGTSVITENGLATIMGYMVQGRLTASLDSAVGPNI